MLTKQKTVSRNYRMDMFTLELMAALQEKTELNQTQLLKKSIYEFAKDNLSDDEINHILRSILD